MTNEDKEVIERAIDLLEMVGRVSDSAKEIALALRGVIEGSDLDLPPVYSSQALEKKLKGNPLIVTTFSIIDEIVYLGDYDPSGSRFPISDADKLEAFIAHAKVLKEWSFPCELKDSATGPNSPRVKDLVWEESSCTESQVISISECVDGMPAPYRVVVDFDITCIVAVVGGRELSTHKTSDEAKAACQEDYTRRILSALQGEGDE